MYMDRPYFVRIGIHPSILPNPFCNTIPTFSPNPIRIFSYAITKHTKKRLALFWHLTRRILICYAAISWSGPQAVKRS